MSLGQFLSSVGFWPALGGHLLLSAAVFLGAVALGLPLGMLAHRYRVLTPALIGAVKLVQTLPAFALFSFFIAAGRRGFAGSMLLALLYTVQPVIFGMEKGLRRAGRPPVDAALGMGMTRLQTLLRILLPLASPQLTFALRQAAVAAVGTVTLATLPGGGLGQLILAGIQQADGRLVAAGTVPVCLLAIGGSVLVELAGLWLVPAPLRRKERPARYIAR